jgi:hypothetical protein
LHICGDFIITQRIKELPSVGMALIGGDNCPDTLEIIRVDKNRAAFFKELWYILLDLLTEAITVIAAVRGDHTI